MKVTIEGNDRDDFPNSKLSNPSFIEAMKQNIRRRLELRAIDTVEIIIKKAN